LTAQPNNPRWDSRSHWFPALESLDNLRFTRTYDGRLSLFYLIQLHKSPLSASPVTMALMRELPVFGTPGMNRDWATQPAETTP
jgi:hypothetical protein